MVRGRGDCWKGRVWSIGAIYRELFIKIVLRIRTENKNGYKYPCRDGAEKCSCTGKMLNIGLILETGACILGCSLILPCIPSSTSCITRAYAPHSINTDADVSYYSTNWHLVMPQVSSKSDSMRSVLKIRLAWRIVLIMEELCLYFRVFIKHENCSCNRSYFAFLFQARF